MKCSAGRYGAMEGSNSIDACNSCPEGWKRGDADKKLTECIQCELGETTETTEFQGSTTCSKCGLGEYGNEPGNCTKCQESKYQDGKGAVQCNTCKDGKLPNAKQTACEKKPWKVPSDCDITTQYLNDSSPNNMNHTCASCPLGASCTGNVGWSQVKAKNGWWRLIAAENRTQPPECLLLYNDITKLTPEQRTKRGEFRLMFLNLVYILYKQLP